MSQKSRKIKLSAIGDIHVKKTDQGQYKDLFQEISTKSDFLLICGDLTDTGSLSEAEVLLNELSLLSIPCVAVLGNHDYEQNQQDQIKNTLQSNKIHILDGNSVEINDIGFVGTKGFGGGFDNYMLSSWGESAIKLFVKEAIDESLKLDSALARLRTDAKIVLLHYSPTYQTIIGESEQIFPFLGSSRLVEPINRRQATAVFHGHAHNGQIKGQTSQNIPVFNVAKPVLLKNGLSSGYFLHEISI